jgi:RNA polymerase sigma factor (TIGR02999 family)
MLILEKYATCDTVSSDRRAGRQQPITAVGGGLMSWKDPLNQELGEDRFCLMGEVTRIIRSIEEGDEHAAAQLLPLVYAELRRLAATRLAQEKPGQTLDATALVHEAYLRLVGDGKGAALHWDHRGHFFAAAAEAMRRILVDAARRKQTVRHGGQLRRIPLQDHHRIAESSDDLLALDEALSRLALDEPSKVELVKLRFFAGLSMPDAAAALGISLSTAERWWAYTRTWLYSELQFDENSDKSTGE